MFHIHSDIRLDVILAQNLLFSIKMTSLRKMGFLYWKQPFLSQRSSLSKMVIFVYQRAILTKNVFNRNGSYSCQKLTNLKVGQLFLIDVDHFRLKLNQIFHLLIDFWILKFFFQSFSFCPILVSCFSFIFDCMNRCNRFLASIYITEKYLILRVLISYLLYE